MRPAHGIGRIVVAAVLVAVSAACGKSPTEPETVTGRIINVSPSELAFGNVNIGASAERTFTITNTGKSTLTFTGLAASDGTGTAGFSASPLTGTIASSGSRTITVHFAPTIGQAYSTTLNVQGDQTGGSGSVRITGTGVNTAPLFTMSGVGDTVFDMPAAVGRVRITADYTKNSSNWIVYIGGRLIVNELIGTGWGTTHLEGTYLTGGGGVVEIKSSSGVAWTFAEVR